MTAPARSSVPRATKERASREQRDTCLRDIADLMSRGRWFVGSSHAEMVEKHGHSLDVVQKLATEASKALRLIVTLDPDEMRARMLASLDEHRRVALDKTTPKGDPMPDVSAANQAVGISGQLLGLVSTRVDVHDARAKFLALPPKEKLAEALKVRKELDAEIAQLRAALKGKK